MHLVGEIELGKYYRLEVVGHAEVDNHVHWFFRDDSVANLGDGIGTNGRGLDGPTPDATCNPGNVSVLPVISVGVPFHGVCVEISTRVLIHAVRHICKRTDSLLELSTTIAVDLGDCWIIDLVVAGGIEGIITSIVGRHL